MGNALVFNFQHAPPSTNTLYANVPGRGRVKSERYRKWKNAAGWDMKGKKYKTLDCPVMLDITVKKRGKVKEDISNKIKALEDLLVEMAVLKDDSLVQEIRVRWGNVIGARVEVMPCDLLTGCEKPQPKVARQPRKVTA